MVTSKELLERLKAVQAKQIKPNKPVHDGYPNVI